MINCRPKHDDRAPPPTRRVSFKPSGNRVVKQSRRDWELAIRSRLEDGDIDMNGAGFSGKSTGRYGCVTIPVTHIFQEGQSPISKEEVGDEIPLYRTCAGHCKLDQTTGLESL
ncbi:unnamed protein product [Timema podura]|uniref:Uncharacterized protein n=1 Tax=Timema podura TaxID=61482 RepID=A0ABN7PGK4_TIMPD|nr:unnamed protein product [Timema podura]